jgi:hypothetical protein
MRIKNIYDISSGIAWFWIYSHPGAGISLKFDPASSKLVLGDETSGRRLAFDPPKDWFVVYMECPQDTGGHVKVYDASNWSVIAEMDLAFYQGGPEETMVFNTKQTSIDVEVDWIGFYSDTFTPPPVPPLPEPTGIDPYNPLWLPMGGWHKVYHFESTDDVTSLFNNWSQVHVLNSNAVLLPLLETYGFAELVTFGQDYTRIALALRLIINNYDDTSHQIMTVSQSRYNKPSGSATIYSDTVENKHSVIIRDNFAGVNYPWTPVEDYVVAVFDYPTTGAGSLTIYDKYGNILFQQQLTERLGSLYQFVLRFTSRNASIYSSFTDAPGQHIIYIDWIALKEIKPTASTPTSGPWAPPDGWTYTWEFTYSTELRQAFNYTYYVFVDEDQVKFNLSWGLAYAARYTGGIWRKIAACVRLVPESLGSSRESLFVVWNDEANVGGVWVEVYTVPGQNAIEVVDMPSGKSTIIPVPGDWFVIEVEYVRGNGGYLRMYKWSGELLHEIQLSNDFVDYTESFVEFIGRNDASGTWRWYIDWFAIKNW